jgi:OmcA/MtrC family decaheme c-type cytochrome
MMSRRTIIKPDACNTCHGTLGAFTATSSPNNFHGVGIGDGNDGSNCVICHNTTGIDSTAYSYNTKPWVHALHAASMRDNPYTPEAAAAQFWNIGYPGLLNNCEVCHVPGSYDFSNSTNAAQVPHMLWDTAAKGTLAVSPTISYPASVTTTTAPITTTIYSVPQSVSQAAALGVTWTPPAIPVTATTTVNGTGYYSPFISETAIYGANVSITAPFTNGGQWVIFPPSAATITATNTTPPATLTGSLVVSPITSACSSCHDTPTAIAHFKANGGVFYGDRLVAGGGTPGTPVAYNNATATKAATITGYVWPSGNLVNTEQCLICHGSGAVADIKAVHMNFN